MQSQEGGLPSPLLPLTSGTGGLWQARRPVTLQDTRKPEWRTAETRLADRAAGAGLWRGNSFHVPLSWRRLTQGRAGYCTSVLG